MDSKKNLRTISKTGVIPMGNEAELMLINYFGRYEVVDEVEKSEKNDN